MTARVEAGDVNSCKLHAACGMGIGMNAPHATCRMRVLRLDGATIIEVLSDLSKNRSCQRNSLRVLCDALDVQS